MNKTIYALATPLGGAIAIIRISGSDTLSVLKKIFTGKISHSRLSHGILTDGSSPVDDIMAVFFKAPHSYTGEDMAELHIHAGRAVAAHAMEILSANGLSPAEAGEFSRRAFLNGKLKLSEAEAVMDLINSTARRSASAAMLQLSGKLSETVYALSDKITDILAELDAMIDYPDEMEDVDPKPQIQSVLNETEALLAHGMNARYLREGFNIAIVGKPNVGKSSLLNALIAEDRAIVTDIAGTTRDLIEADASFCGFPVHLFDTAGLHDTCDRVEKMGIERAKNAIKSADLIYAVLDASTGVQAEDVFMLNETKNLSRIIIWNKSDAVNDGFAYTEEYGECCTVSTVTGEGLEELKRKTADKICPDDESGLITNMRHIQALSQAKLALTDALSAQETDAMSQDLHIALRKLALITGDAVDENVIDRIFERFCVGK